MNAITVTGDQVLVVLAVLLTVVLVAVAGRVLLAAAVIAGIQWLVIHYLAVKRHPGVGGARGARAAGRLHPGRRADRLDRARPVPAPPPRRWTAMSTDDTRVPGTAVEKRPSAELATRAAAEADRPGQTPVRGRRVLYATVRRRAGRAVPGPRTRTVLRWLIRNSVLYLLTGAWVLARRGWEARTNARYERQMRAAEAAGDQEKLSDWETRAERAREQRHRRRMDWITAPIEFARTAAALLLVADRRPARARRGARGRALGSDAGSSRR